jgi:hypothetical protein
MVKKKMNPLSYDLGNALLERHRRICSKFTGSAEDVSETIIEEAIIAYKQLLREIGAPESLTETIGRYLGPLAEWCQVRNLPPINALAVNSQLQRPGPGYYVAPGCGDWDREVKECIACKRYPDAVTD